MFHSRLIKLFALTLLAVGSVRAKPAQADERAAPSPGKADFLEFCAECHGRSGKGDGPIGLLLSPPAADLTRIAERNGGRFDDTRARRFIDGRLDVKAHGSRVMPVWGDDFQVVAKGQAESESHVQNRIWRLIAFLRDLQVDLAPNIASAP